jgi:hypothetical protein
VQCCFGILKRRFKMLRVPQEWQDESTVELTFHACCILHNMLLIRSGRDCIFEDEQAWLQWEAEDEPPTDCTRVGAEELPNPVDVDEVPAEFQPTFEELRGALVTHFQVAHEELRNTQWLQLTVYEE